MPHWLITAGLASALFLLEGCGQGEPGTPMNHPIVWIVGLSIGFCGIMAGLAMLTGILRRYERREDRRERRDERGA
jgi:hypothetical protein